MRKNHGGSISSTDSGHSEAMTGGFCDVGNVYHLTSSILHNAPLPPRRHSTTQQGTTNPTIMMVMNGGSTVQSTKHQQNGDISSMPPPPNPRTTNSRPVPPLPFPLVGAPQNVAGYNIYTAQQQQLRHVGELINL